MPELARRDGASRRPSRKERNRPQLVNVVDAADYAIWLANYGALNAPGDANGDGKTDAADYTIWRDELALADQEAGIELGDTTDAALQNTLTVGGKAAFASDAFITIGPAGVFKAGLLNFNAPGAVTIQEDSSTAIAMTNTAGTLSLTSTSDITDVPTPDPAMPAMMLATTITVTGDATFTSGGSITLADTAPDVPAGKPGDELAVAGKASFLSAGAITIGSDGFLPAGNFTGGKFTAGLLNFNAPGVVTIEEDIATPTDPTPGSAIVMDNTAGTLVLTSAGNIVDGDPSLAGPPATSITVTGDATFNAVGLIKLANQDSDKLLVDGRASFAAGGSGTRR